MSLETLGYFSCSMPLYAARCRSVSVSQDTMTICLFVFWVIVKLHCYVPIYVCRGIPCLNQVIVDNLTYSISFAYSQVYINLLPLISHLILPLFQGWLG